MKWLVPILLLVVSCGPGQLAYQDGVHPVSIDKAHPLYGQLLPLIDQPTTAPDTLIRTWKDFLGETPLPLRVESTFTFVYYDFTHTLDKVFLEATFAPGRQEPLSRVGKTSLFVRVYTIPKPSRAQYRFSSGTTPLVDPFHAALEDGEELWQPLVSPVDGGASVQWVAGVAEPELQGQDITVLLPPSYHRNLAQTYPLVVVTGMEGRGWTKPLAQMMQEDSLRPFLAVAIGRVDNLKAVLEERVVPFVRSRYRASPLAADLVLVGWGPMAKATQDMVAGRQDAWPRTWIAPEQTRTDEAWNTAAAPYLRTLFTVVAP